MTYTGISLALINVPHLRGNLPLLAAADITPTENPESSRKLIIGTNRPDVPPLIIVRASDVPTYVQYGAIDPGMMVAVRED